MSYVLWSDGLDPLPRVEASIARFSTDSPSSWEWNGSSDLLALGERGEGPGTSLKMTLLSFPPLPTQVIMVTGDHPITVKAIAKGALQDRTWDFS